MTKFEIKENTREISYENRTEIKAGCTLRQNNQEPIMIKSYDSKEQALEVLKEYKTDIRELSGTAGTYYSITEYYVEENEYDKDGEWVSGGDIWEFSKMTIELVKKPSCDTIEFFDNYEEAEKAYNDYEGENEVYISF